MLSVGTFSGMKFLRNVALNNINMHQKVIKPTNVQNTVSKKELGIFSKCD